jgi:hypothetical protein
MLKEALMANAILERQEMMTKEFSLDIEESELSFFRSDPTAVRKQEEDIETMLATAKRLDASAAIIKELTELAKFDETENELSETEIGIVAGLIDDAKLSQLGLTVNPYGLAFTHNTPGLGDGTVPVMDLDLIISNFEWLFNHVKTRLVSAPVFSGVVFLEERTNGVKSDDKSRVALVIRGSLIKLQRQTVVWEDI